MVVEHSVWGIPPSGRDKECHGIYPPERWQWAQKLKKLLEDKGFREVVIIDTEPFEEIGGETEE